MPDEIKPGDMVQHKSGGPEMYVESVGESSTNPGVFLALCSRNDNGRLASDSYPVASLKHFRPPKVGGMRVYR